MTQEVSDGFVPDPCMATVLVRLRLMNSLLADAHKLRLTAVGASGHGGGGRDAERVRVCGLALCACHTMQWGNSAKM